MTREQAIEELKTRYLTMSQCLNKEELHKANEALDMAIKALEQEPILDKIYADIQRLRGCSCSCSDGIIDDVEDIIDKYKGESEDKE